MKLFEDYLNAVTIRIEAPPNIDNFFIKQFVDDYKKLLNRKRELGDAFIEESKNLKIYFKRDNSDANTEDFDLVFISYLALLKFDFPNLDIAVYFYRFEEHSNYGRQFYQLAQHRQHLIINGKQEFFKLFLDDREYRANLIANSGSYLPLLVINPASATALFAKKVEGKDFKSIIDKVLNTAPVKYFEDTNREAIFSNFQHHYTSIKGRPLKWSFADLSALYLVRMIYDLYLFRFMLDEQKQTKTDYQVGQSIISSKNDPDCANEYRKKVYQTLRDNGVFHLSDVEAYLLSIIVRHNEIFKIPNSLHSMADKMKGTDVKHEKSSSKWRDKILRRTYIAAFCENLARVISYAKDLAYGLEELAKNIIEHTGGQYGIISGRIYRFNRLSNLKTVEKDWAANFVNTRKFLDLNVIDSGLIAIKQSYCANLAEEKTRMEGEGDPLVLKIIEKEYADDLDQVARFDLNDFFNFNSVTLYHQINRVKARLGLLVFSQIVLNEKSGLMHISSNGIEELRPLGYFLFQAGGKIAERISKDYFAVGTNYNFIIPVEESFQFNTAKSAAREAEMSVSSSVFLELHEFGKNKRSAGHSLKTITIDLQKLNLNKYKKLNFVKDAIGACGDAEVAIIDAGQLEGVIVSPSDWVRLLANLQFTGQHIKNIIIYRMDPERYLEMLTILKFFDTIPSDLIGFWRKDRFCLFFFPVSFNEGLFWFNSLLTGKRYTEFAGINREIGRYHLHLDKITAAEKGSDDSSPVITNKQSPLFSTGGKLLNFELLIENEPGLSLFEETTRSMLQIEIQDRL